MNKSDHLNVSSDKRSDEQVTLVQNEQNKREGESKMSYDIVEVVGANSYSSLIVFSEASK